MRWDHSRCCNWGDAAVAVAAGVAAVAGMSAATLRGVAVLVGLLCASRGRGSVKCLLLLGMVLLLLLTGAVEWGDRCWARPCAKSLAALLKAEDTAAPFSLCCCCCRAVQSCSMLAELWIRSIMEEDLGARGRFCDCWDRGWSCRF